jgi:hypothetical protein
MSSILSRRPTPSERAERSVARAARDPRAHVGVGAAAARAPRRSRRVR